MSALTYTSGTAIYARMAIEGQTNSTAGTAIFDAIGTAVNEIIEGYIGAPVGPAGTAARTYDGDGSNVLRIRQGINAITQLRIRDLTGGTWSTVSSSEYVLRPGTGDRRTGWPAFKVVLTDAATTYTTYTIGYDTVEVTPGTATTDQFGWPAIPVELSQLGIVLGTRMIQARQSGETLVIGSTDFGQSIARFLPEPEYRAILNRYRDAVARFAYAA
jgi:hypothetical protein